MLRLYLNPEQPPGSTLTRSPPLSTATLSAAMNLRTSSVAWGVRVIPTPSAVPLSVVLIDLSLASGGDVPPQSRSS